MKSTNNPRIRQCLLVPLSALLIIACCKTWVCDAFALPARSTAPQFAPSVGHRSPSATYMSTLEVEYEPTNQESQNIEAPIDASAIQSRSLSPNFLINSSILLVAIITIFYQVLSVDIGITRGWNAEEIAARIPLDNWRSYTNVLNLAPLQTKAVTSATVYTIGDILSQNKEGKDMGSLDRGRICRSLLAGLIGHGPMSHVWYHVSEDFFDGVLVGHHWWDFIPKVVVDQVRQSSVNIYACDSWHMFIILYFVCTDYIRTHMEQFLHHSSWSYATPISLPNLV